MNGTLLSQRDKITREELQHVPVPEGVKKSTCRRIRCGKQRT